MNAREHKPFDDMHEDRNGHQHADSDCFECVCGDPACWHAPDPSARNCRGECDRPNCECPAAVFAEDVEQPARRAS
jgi:hypothetical protein